MGLSSRYLKFLLHFWSYNNSLKITVHDNRQGRGMHGASPQISSWPRNWPVGEAFCRLPNGVMGAVAVGWDVYTSFSFSSNRSAGTQMQVLLCTI